MTAATKWETADKQLIDLREHSGMDAMMQENAMFGMRMRSMKI